MNEKVRSINVYGSHILKELCFKNISSSERNLWMNQVQRIKGRNKENKITMVSGIRRSENMKVAGNITICSIQVLVST